MKFATVDHQTWTQLFEKQTPLREQQIIPEFSAGLEKLNMTSAEIPNLESVNRILKNLTGWQGVYVKGLIEAVDFFSMLSGKMFPIGSFIRDSKNLAYTPEPDVFHDFYGHIPFYTIPEYANCCQDFGTRALRYKHSSEIVDEFQRLFWFTFEFALVKTPQGKRIFGGGIASSYTECAYALSDKPKIVRFDPEAIRGHSYRIDILQDTLYLLDSPKQLYNSLDQFESKYRK